MMMKRQGWRFLLLVFALSVAGLVWSGEKDVKAVKKSQAKRDITLEGKAVCIGCQLKKAEGAHSACKIYGHKHGLMDKEGRLYTFVENDRSVQLIKGEGVHGKRIKVKGDLFPQAQYIDLKSYEVEEEEGKWVEMAWCEHCNVMGLAAEHKHERKSKY